MHNADDRENGGVYVDLHILAEVPRQSIYVYIYIYIYVYIERERERERDHARERQRQRRWSGTRRMRACGAAASQVCEQGAER